MESISHFKLLKRSAFPLVFPDLVNSTLFTKMLKLKPYSHLDLGFYFRATVTSLASLPPYHPEHNLSHLILEDKQGRDGQYLHGKHILFYLYYDHPFLIHCHNYPRLQKRPPNWLWPTLFFTKCLQQYSQSSVLV